MRQAALKARRKRATEDRAAALRRKRSDEQPVAARRPAYMARAKMAVSQPQDAQEQEANRVADQVSGVARQAAMPTESPEVQSQRAEEPVPAARQVRRAADEEAVQELRRQAAEEPAEAQTLARIAEDPEAIKTGLRRAAEEETPTAKRLVRRQADEASERDDADTADARSSISDDLERRIENMLGGGSELPDDVREDMQAKLGHDFTAVRIHTDGEANEIAKRIQARAFTVGTDIFFAAGEYAPSTEQGRKLLAHELTHVMQNRSTLDRKTVRRADDATGGNGDGGAPANGTYHQGEGWVEFASLPYPKVAKVPDTHFGSFLPLIRHRAYLRSTNQSAIWFGQLDYQGAKNKLGTAPGYSSEGATGHLIFKVPSPYSGIRPTSARRDTQGKYLMGSLDEIAQQAARPTWTPQGTPAPLEGRQASYEIDHVVEAQAGARAPRGARYEMRSEVDSMANYVLLRGRKNQRKGEIVRGNMEAALQRFITGNDAQYRNKPFSDWEVRALKGHLSMQFNAVATQAGLVDIDNDDVWTRGEIEAGAHIQALIDHGQIQCVSLSQLEDQVPDHRIWVFHRRSGGLKRELDVRSPARDFLTPFKLHEDSVFHEVQNAQDGTDLATFYFYIDDNNPTFKPLAKSAPVQIKSLLGSRKLGYFEEGRVQALIGVGQQAGRRPEVKQTSPIEVDSVELQERGLAVTGRILPTISLFEDASIDFELLGNDITFSKTFLIDEINVPPPFEIRGSSITVSAGSSGFGVQGDIDFAIERLGEGSAEASYHSRRGLRVLGTFDFDERMFGRGADAQIRFRYENGEWGIGGTVTVPRGKVPGIRTATINADYSESTGFSASGEAELDIPGVQRGTLEVTQNEEEGLSIGGTFTLSNDIPGIRGGSISARLRERADGEGFSVAASGEAQPDIPGFDSTLRVEYEDGAITMQADARYSRGMLDGTVRAGATNRTLDSDGNPTGEPGETLIVFGGGSLTIQIAPWLEGTVGIAFAPNGEITVSGEIALPSQIEIFPRREIDKSIFNIAVQAPIVPGIVAEVGGGLSAQAGIGPGVIDELRIGIEYNPAHEENTHVTGDAHLSVPADAGLRLSVRAGIGLGITGASATGGLEIGGTLGIEGAAEAGVHLDWMPTTGLDIAAQLSVHAQPSFKFDLSGYVSVRALGFSVYDNRWEFASFEFGSDYRFGIRLPVHYHEGEPFDISLDDVEFDVPPIDTGQLLRGLIERVT